MVNSKLYSALLPHRGAALGNLGANIYLTYVLANKGPYNRRMACKNSDALLGEAMSLFPEGEPETRRMYGGNRRRFRRKIFEVYTRFAREGNNCVRARAISG